MAMPRDVRSWGRPVRILGGGLAGLCAAINLAQAGVPVTVLERRQEVGGRFRGDFQAIRNWVSHRDNMTVLRQMNLKTDFPYHPVKRLFVTNGTDVTPFSFHRPIHCLVERGPGSASLDQALKRQAIEVGVDLQLGQTCPESQVDIVATGPGSGQIFAIARGLVFETSMQDCVWGLVHDRAAPAGYAYLVVWRGRGCLVTVLFKHFTRAKDAFHRTRDIFEHLVELDMKNPRPMGGVGSFMPQARFEQAGVWRIGEAAGLQDYAWGFGMDLALASGHLAAHCLLEGRDYARAARRLFSGPLKSSMVNRFFWDHFSLDRGYRPSVAFMRLCRNPMVPLYLSHKYTPLQRAVYPLARAWFHHRNRDTHT